MKKLRTGVGWVMQVNPNNTGNWSWMSVIEIVDGVEGYPNLKRG